MGSDYVRIDTFISGVGHWSMEAYDIERLELPVRAQGQGRAALMKAQADARDTLAARREATREAVAAP